MEAIQRVGVHGDWYRKNGLAGDAAWSAGSAIVLICIPIILAIVASSAFLFASLGPIIYQLIERRSRRRRARAARSWRTRSRSSSDT